MTGRKELGVKRHEELQGRLGAIESEVSALREQLKELQDACTHPQLPKREFGEEYRDICPDCGFVAYCYAMG